MSVFTLAISCLTTSNLPWFIDLTFQVLMQYCSFQRQTLLPSPVTSTVGHCFHFGSVSSFFLVLFLHSSPVAYWAPTDRGSSSFSVISFCLFVLFIGFSSQEYWSGLPFPSSVDHVWSESPPWPLQLEWPYMAWLIVSLSRQGCGPWSVWLVFSDCGFHSVFPLWDKDKRLMEASWWERLTVGETGSCSDGQGHAQ